MKYLLVIPKGSFKHHKEFIRLLGGFWNGIGYAFHIDKKDFVDRLLGAKEVLQKVIVEWDGSWEEYRAFCREDYQYVELCKLKVERHCLHILEETDEQAQAEERDSGSGNCPEGGNHE